MNFAYGRQASQNFDVVLASFSTPDTHRNGGSSMMFTTDKAPRSLKNYLLDSTPDEPLTFDIEIFCKSETMRIEKLMFVKSWLCGRLGYDHFIIQHPDFEDMYFNCVFHDPEDIYINGYNGLKVTALCDAGGAWQNPHTKTFNLLDNGGRFIFNNLSHSNDYMYPSISFTVRDGYSSFSIVNETDNNRKMEFTDLVGGETIEINGETGEIKSSLGVRRIKNFNKNYLRFKRAPNVLQTNAGSSTLNITYQNFIRLGGG